MVYIFTEFTEDTNVYEESDGISRHMLMPYNTYYLTSSPHTHTHNRFTALLEFVWDYPGEQVPER